MRKSKTSYNENVDYDSLEQNTYDDSDGDIFYTCPICHQEYLSTFMHNVDGETMCIDCWSERHGE